MSRSGWVAGMYVKEYEELRRVLALMMGGLMVLFLIHVTLLGMSADSIADGLDRVRAHEAQAREEYLELALEIDRAGLRSLESTWYDLQEDHRTDGSLIPRFAFSAMDAFLESYCISVVLLQTDETTYRKAWVLGEYEEVREILDAVEPGHSFLILNGDPQEPFGTGERIYLQGRQLITPEGNRVHLYLGFYEPPRIAGFVNAADLDALGDAQGAVSAAVSKSVALILVFIAYGFAMLGLMRLKSRKAAVAFMEDNQVQICGDSVLGSIAIEKGYLTIPQLSDCLETQTKKRKEGSSARYARAYRALDEEVNTKKKEKSDGV